MAILDSKVRSPYNASGGPNYHYKHVPHPEFNETMGTGHGCHGDGYRGDGHRD